MGHRLVVAESDSGEVSSVDLHTGAVKTLLSGLFGPQGVAYSDGRLYVAIGGPPPPEEGPQPPAGAKTSVLLIAKPGGPVLKTIDLLAYELKHNPDGQVQFVDGQPVDALSNPYSVLAQDDRVLVADAGANDVLAVDKDSGRISTFFVPPTVKQSENPLCTPEAQSNPGTKGCDPVPTGIVQGPDGLLYVSTLGALTPGASRVYVLTQSGHVVRVIDDLDSVTGVEVDKDGAVYVTELLAGAPEGPPPANFDPSTIGQIVRIDRHGHRTYAQVTTPSSVEIEEGQLYSTANSIGLDPSMPADGQLVRVSPRAFTSMKG
jgi:sugar lactone lactonase YvrE